MNLKVHPFVLCALLFACPMLLSAEEIAVNTSDSSLLTIVGVIFFGLFVLFSFANRVIAARRRSESPVNHSLKQTS